MSKLGLIKESHISLNLEKEDFISILKFNTDQSSALSFITDLFSTKHTKYKGYVNKNNFAIRFKTQLSNFSLNYTIINGTFEQENEKLNLNIRVSSINNLFYLVLLSLILSVIFISVLIYYVAYDVTAGVIYYSIMSIILFLISSIEFFRMRTSVKKAVDIITSDFKKMTRK